MIRLALVDVVALEQASHGHISSEPPQLQRGGAVVENRASRRARMQAEEKAAKKAARVAKAGGAGKWPD